MMHIKKYFFLKCVGWQLRKSLSLYLTLTAFQKCRVNHVRIDYKHILSTWVSEQKST